MPTIWTPVNALFLVGVALTIVFLIIHEIVEARRPHVAARIDPARRRTHRTRRQRAAAERAEKAATASRQSETGRGPAAAIRQSALD
jgi:F0F1-type ATP synthase membrane subunit b/b'